MQLVKGGKDTSYKSEFVQEFLVFAESHSIEELAETVW